MLVIPGHDHCERIPCRVNARTVPTPVNTCMHASQKPHSSPDFGPNYAIFTGAGTSLPTRTIPTGRSTMNHTRCCPGERAFVAHTSCLGGCDLSFPLWAHFHARFGHTLVHALGSLSVLVSPAVPVSTHQRRTAAAGSTSRHRVRARWISCSERRRACGGSTRTRP